MATNLEPTTVEAKLLALRLLRCNDHLKKAHQALFRLRQAAREGVLALDDCDQPIVARELAEMIEEVVGELLPKMQPDREAFRPSVSFHHAANEGEPVEPVAATG